MALVLTGTEHVDVADSVSVKSPSTAITIAGWVLRDSVGSDDNGAQWIWGDDTVYRIVKDGIGNSDDITAAIRVDGSFTSLGDIVDGAIPGGTWRFHVLRWESGGQVLLEAYDTGGTLVDSATTAGSPTGSLTYADPYSLIFSRPDTNDRWTGRLAGIYIHDARLTNTQVTDLLDDTVSLTTDSGFTAPAITPSAGYWPLDFDARDASGNGNDGTAVNSPAFTETAPSGTPVGRVTETETARALTASKAAAFGRVAETEATRGFTTSKTVAFGRTTETETARGFTASKTATFGRATETETARGFTVAKTADFSRVAEVETVRAFTAAFGQVYGRVTESEQARSFTASKTATFGRVVETETARAFSTGSTTADPITLPPYRETPVPDYMEAAVPAYREPSVPAFQESAS